VDDAGFLKDILFKIVGRGEFMSKVIMIGSGFGGLGAAIRLAARGHQVELFEKRDKLGGRAYVYELNGFKFDGGPTVITAPFMFDDLWAAAGKQRADYFHLVPCDPFYRIFDYSGRSFDYNGDETFRSSNGIPPIARATKSSCARRKLSFRRAFSSWRTNRFSALWICSKSRPISSS
jgi:protoporphyrinogen oxidase